MNNTPAHPRFSPPSKNQNQSRSSAVKPFELEKLDENHAMVMVVVFFASAFTIVPFFNRTLITVIEASQLFMVFGLAGFLITYLIRNRFGLSILDGLFYNLFGSAPVGLALFLSINAQCQELTVENYRVVDREPGGTGYTFILENDALKDYWHIRTLDKHETNTRKSRVQYTFCEGYLGYQVMKKRELVF